MFDVKTLFNSDVVTFFEGVPDKDVLEPGGVGVNAKLFPQIKLYYKKAKQNMACRVLADICMDIQDDGYIGRQEDSAIRVGTHWTTINRWRARFANDELLKRHNLNGLFSVDAKVAIRLGVDSKIIKPIPFRRHRFRY